MFVRVIQGDLQFYPLAVNQQTETFSVVVMSGEAQLETDTEVIFLSPATNITVATQSLKSISFTEAEALIFQLPQMSNHPELLTKEKIIDEISAMIIQDVFFDNKRPEEHQLSALELLFHQIVNTTDTEPAKEKSLDNIISDYMAENLDENLTLEAIAKHFSFSKGYILKVFRDKNKLSPMKLLAEMRINKAKKLLERSELNIALIAATVGYSDLSTFNHFFKRYTNTSPREYKENHRWLL